MLESSSQNIQALFDTCLEKCRRFLGHLINSVRGREHPAGALFLLKKQAQGFLEVRKYRVDVFLCIFRPFVPVYHPTLLPCMHDGLLALGDRGLGPGRVHRG